MLKIKFIHTADLHLDTPFKGLSSWNADLSKKLKDATFKSFKNIIDLCINKKVDFLIISGDIFDSENKSLAAQLKFVTELKRLSDKGIATYFTCGNHDPLKSWLDTIKLPENVYRFDSSKVKFWTFKKEDKVIADIHGISFNDKDIKENLAADFKLAPNPAPISIAVLHGTIGIPGPHENYAPFKLKDVVNKRFDYWAMGHIHKRQVVNSSNPAIIYPGNPQGRDFGESGEKGCYLVEISKGNDPGSEFIPTQLIRFEDLTIDITGVDQIELLQGKIKEAIERVENYDENANYILRITLRGRTGLHSSLNDQVQVEELVQHYNEEHQDKQNFIWIDKIYVNTQPDIGIEKIKKGVGFSSEILKSFDVYLEDNKKLIELIKTIEEDFVNAQAKREIAEFTGDIHKEMLEKAKMLLLDKLIKEE
ncbi:MAG: DNA repair exonuclease [Bacteroidales bacterium]|nr:DNA repair exonuclease [Bacteroidales bacterium]